MYNVYIFYFVIYFSQNILLLILSKDYYKSVY